MLAALLTAFPGAAAGQTPQPIQSRSPAIEVAIALGATRVFRANDVSFGTTVSPGASVRVWVNRSVRAEAAVNWLPGLSPRPAPCGLVGVVCSGSGRDGLTDATTASASVAYVFGRRVVRPYALLGLGMIHSRAVSSTTIVRGSSATISETAGRDTGWGPVGGAGLEIDMGPRVVLRPELRLGSGSWRGRENVSVLSSSIAVGYRW